LTNTTVIAVQTPGGHQTELNLRPVTELRILLTGVSLEPVIKYLYLS